MSAIYLVKNRVSHTRMKHIDVRYHFVRDVLEDGRYRGEEDSHQRQSRRHAYKGGSLSQI